MSKQTIQGWTRTRGDGVVTLTKGEHAIETTFNPEDEAAAALADDHALAQAYAFDTPTHELDGMSVDDQWRTIHAWAGEGD